MSTNKNRSKPVDMPHKVSIASDSMSVNLLGLEDYDVIRSREANAAKNFRANNNRESMPIDSSDANLFQQDSLFMQMAGAQARAKQGTIDDKMQDPKLLGNQSMDAIDTRATLPVYFKDGYVPQDRVRDKSRVEVR